MYYYRYRVVGDKRNKLNMIKRMIKFQLLNEINIFLINIMHDFSAILIRYQYRMKEISSTVNEILFIDGKNKLAQANYSENK